MKIGAYAVERDYSHYIAYAAKTILAVVGTATKGPIGKATVCTSTQDLVNKFGPLKTDCYALYAGQYFLSQSSKLYFVRAASDAAAASSVSIAGVNTSDAELPGAIKLSTLEKGTYADGYTVTVAKGKPVYNFSIKIGSSTAATISHVSLDSLMDLSYSNDYFKVSSRNTKAVQLTPDTYEFSENVASIYGIDDKSGLVSNAVTLTATQAGITSVDVTTTETYNLVLKNKSGVTVHAINGLPLSEMTTEYSNEYFKITNVESAVASLTPGIYTFAGGNDGISDITAADYINAANALISDQIDMNIFAVPGVSDAAVVTAMLALAENRGDCLYLVDPPAGLTREGVVDWHNGGGEYNHSAFNSSYGALYYDWVTIYDSVNKVRVDVPPSVVVAATYAYSDRTTEVWYAPAGLTRGLVRGVLDSVTKLGKSDTEYLYNNNNAVNSIYDDPQVGLVLWGQKTLSRADTALNRVNVRRLLNYMKRVISAACNYLTFEPNDRVTWNSFEMKVLPFLKNIQSKRGIYEYRVVKGETIVTDEDIDNYRMPCMIAIRPTKSAEEIPIYFVLSSTGADFNEVLAANGVVTD